jgi:hypothetical protein
VIRQDPATGSFLVTYAGATGDSSAVWAMTKG